MGRSGSRTATLSPPSPSPSPPTPLLQTIGRKLWRISGTVESFGGGLGGFQGFFFLLAEFDLFKWNELELMK